MRIFQIHDYALDRRTCLITCYRYGLGLPQPNLFWLRYQNGIWLASFIGWTPAGLAMLRYNPDWGWQIFEESRALSCLGGVADFWGYERMVGYLEQFWTLCNYVGTGVRLGDNIVALRRAKP